MALITCTHCGASGKAPDKILGQQVRCSKCKQNFLAEAPPPSVERSPFSLDEEPEPPPQDDGEGFPTNDDDIEPTPAGRPARQDHAQDVVVPRSASRKSGGGGVGEFFMFRRLVAPQLIVVLFWLLLIGVLLGSLGAIGFGFSQGTAGIPFALGGIVYLVVGPLAVRLMCEVLVVIFRINETLTDIRDDLSKRGDSSSRGD